MFKAFRGYDLVEALHFSKIRNYSKTIITLSIALIASLSAWFAPASFFGIPDLSIIEQRVIAIFIFATLMWVMEVVPAWTTLVLVIVILLLTVSDSRLWFMAGGDPFRELGTVVKYRDIMATFADPIIMLFLGGFILAIAATKCGLDVSLARVLLKPFGTKSENVLLGFIVVTAFFSMFVSNTATAAMMLTILTPVLRALPADGKGKVGLALSIPVAANIGGIGTPIGTPPNAIALKYLNDEIGLNIGFSDWMLFMFPFVIVLLVISWYILLKMFPFKQKNIELVIEGEFRKDPKAYIIYVTFATTIILWLLDKYTGVNANTVALIPVAVFCVTGIITRRDLEEINWSVLWMVAGGFALGVALNKTGLAQHLVSAIPFDSWSPLLVIIGSGLLCWLMANFISHTATATLLVPILAAVGIGMGETLFPVGGNQTLLIGIAVASSLAMMLPISTPPNALAHATGLIEQSDMQKIGIIVGLIGLVLGYILLIAVGVLNLW